MGKDTLFAGQPVFTQLLGLIPKHIVRDLSGRHDSDRYYKRFKTYEHLVTMLYSTFHGCKSLREVITGMMACNTRVNHLGITYFPRRSTLADANCNRSEQFFAELYKALYAFFYSDSPMKKSIDKRLFILDATVISLFSEALRGSGGIPVSGKRKGGVKAHVLMKANEDVPRFVCLTAANQNDKIFMSQIHLPANSILTFDKGYLDYKIFHQWTQASITWVTRFTGSSVYKLLRTDAVLGTEKEKGIIGIERIQLGAKKIKTKVLARKITYHDKKTNKTLVFITNDMRMRASSIAQIYQRRWQIESLFKRFKQNYPLKYFLGDNENAIKIQIWCALLTDLLIKVIKDRVKRKWSFSNVVSLIRLHLMTYIDLIKFLSYPETVLKNYKPPDYSSQLSLFKT